MLKSRSLNLFYNKNMHSKHYLKITLETLPSAFRLSTWRKNLPQLAACPPSVVVVAKAVTGPATCFMVQQVKLNGDPFDIIVANRASLYSHYLACAVLGFALGRCRSNESSRAYLGSCPAGWCYNGVAEM